MQYIQSFLSIAGAFLTIIGAFIAGWFVATDKNRSELFKQKLGAYKNLSGQISKVYTLGVTLDKIEEPNADCTEPGIVSGPRVSFSTSPVHRGPVKADVRLPTIDAQITN
jgi:hypothetical protein